MTRPSLAALLLWFAAPALGDGIQVRIMPPARAQLLQYQRFDLRVEAAAPPGATVTDLRVSVDGADVTGRGQVAAAGTGSGLSWTYRDAAFGIAGPRLLSATASGTSGGGPVSGAAAVTLTVRSWDVSRARPFAGRPSPAAAAGRPRARNVILLVGDGMGVAHRTAARVLSKGYTEGKANGLLAMDRLPFNGLLMTSSLDALVTDSAAGASCWATGNKAANGMLGVFPDDTAAEDDNPRVEQLPAFLHRTLGTVTGVVTDAFATDATPAAFLARTSNRGNGTAIASQYFDLRAATGLKVLMGGGASHFIPKSRSGSRRTDERDLVAAFQADGWPLVESRSALAAHAPSGAEPRLLGLFHPDDMSSALDKLGMGDPGVVGRYNDQPFLKEMTRKALDVLSRYPDGFFLLVEGAHVDKQAHRMDAERSILDVIQLDQAVQVALDFAAQTNGDADPDNDTLVIVTADHETSGLVLAGVGVPERKGTRDYVRAYGTGSARTSFPDYVDADGDGYPDNPGTARKLVMSFGASHDHWEDWTVSPRPRSSGVPGGADPGVVRDGVAVANPDDPKRLTPGALLVTGVIENGSGGGVPQTQAVHTATDVPVSASGPGSWQLARVNDDTELFFAVFEAMLGTYPVPAGF